MKLFAFNLPVKISFFVILLSICLSAAANPTYSQTVDNVNVRVRTAICGDGEAEGSEDCDNNDLDGAVCEDLGYAGGNLFCTSTCEFDTTECISPTPTPTPTPTPSPADSSSSSDSSSQNTSVTETTESEDNKKEKDKDKNENKEKEGVLDFLKIKIPKSLDAFDANSDQKLSHDELTSSVGSWVDDWDISQKEVYFDTKLERVTLPDNKSCDINKDGICNLVDFSILLYYIGR